MAGLLTPILNEIQIALRATLNTEKDVFDSTLADVRSDAIRIELPNLFAEEYPWVNIFPFNEFIPNQQSNITDNIPWGVAVTVEITGDNSEQLLKDIDVYTSAVLKSIIKHGADWTLNGKCDQLTLNTITPNAFVNEPEGGVVVGNFLQFTFDVEYNLTT